MSEYLKQRRAIMMGLQPKAGKKEPVPIAKQSEKRKIDHKQYRKIVKEMLLENPNCEIKEQGCQGKASGLHHQKKRTPATYLDKKFLKRSCGNCKIGRAHV